MFTFKDRVLLKISETQRLNLRDYPNIFYQRYYRPSKSTLMARNMVKVGFGVDKKRLVVLLKKDIGTDSEGQRILGCGYPNLILLTERTGQMGPFGVLHALLHELTHSIGILGHGQEFRAAYLKAGKEFKWFNRINGDVFCGDGVELRPFNGFVR